MSDKIKFVLKSGKDQSVRRLHPWVFSGAIKKIYGDPAEGALVHVYDNKDELLATGHFQEGSIAVRILAFKDIDTNEDFWFERFKTAYDLRLQVGLADSSQTSVYRLINAEGDSLPGLIVDHYDGNLVIQAHSIGMFRNIEVITSALKKLYGNKLKSVFDKSATTMPFLADIGAKNQSLYGDSNNAIILENGLKFKVDWNEGQKTGFFIDQRENRELLEKFSKGKKVLNMFCYTGGFSVYALRAGAEFVHSVDSSAKAIDLMNENVKLNFPDCNNHTSLALDAFNYLEDIKDKYDLIILDPPAFAKHQNVLHNALQGYKRINQRAFEQIRKGGILFTFSCSQVVTRENFRKSVFAAAANSGRTVRILHQLSQPADHPVSIYHPEGEYLKGLVLHVE
jgi:23S rRNA (cytosine1962-C5)-methyltransferase